MKLTRYFFVVAVSTALATGLTGCLSQDEFLEEHSYKFDSPNHPRVSSMRLPHHQRLDLAITTVKSQFHI